MQTLRLLFILFLCLLHQQRPSSDSIIYWSLQKLHSVWPRHIRLLGPIESNRWNAIKGQSRPVVARKEQLFLFPHYFPSNGSNHKTSEYIHKERILSFRSLLLSSYTLSSYGHNTAKDQTFLCVLTLPLPFLSTAFDRLPTIISSSSFMYQNWRQNRKGMRRRRKRGKRRSLLCSTASSKVKGCSVQEERIWWLASGATNGEYIMGQ